MKVLAFVFILLSSHCVLAQQDSSTFDKKALIAPSILISYGVAGTYTDIAISYTHLKPTTKKH